ncbi:flagellar basal body L-ring protein FlgH [Selenomonas sputigena]|jgi:flagellar L-ring protein|uniref:Flagellar L-ring protein n=1 Tax=Selenomonas sputigena (strain ATCC 35185 / DSM 20758 / CCUG 44933 / VPI D19B-28) TaxID=546271 RepID=C9LRG6_SELS3|nr:flagellar basal body L-ring protein FlgH [Selenomonas sputigena]AEC00912.1 flagellar L-ring protein [Selenomonas sputigena ATCC 35185]EEX78432.1 flagellar L-ring protein FlgH [Selenomonas sputigena ATCC 35185]
MRNSRKWQSFVLAGVFGGALFFAPTVFAQSLWADATEGTSYGVFADRKAHNVGDTLTIVISEKTTTTQTKSRKNGKSASTKLNAGAGIFDFLTAASAGGSDSWKADGSAKDSSNFSGNIAVTVVEVQPNGNMVVEGTQSIWQNKDEHKITLRGIVRRDDVTYENTVPSTKVADATVRFDGKGPLNAKQRQGILTQILNILF